MSSSADQPEVPAVDTSELQMSPPPAPGAAVSMGDSNDVVRLPLILEALLLAADGPLTLDQLQRLLAPDYTLSRTELREALAQLAQRLETGATVLSEVASGWRLQVRAEYAGWVSRLWTEKPARMTRAALETLALVVYRQPITRGEIEDIRGVAVSSNVMRGLLERGWIREVGHKEVPGRPALFGTTAQFLDDFALKSLDQLPALPEIKDVAQLEAALARLMPGSEAGDSADGEAGNEASDQTADALGADAKVSSSNPNEHESEQAHAGEA